jgi:hypothetical protein
LGLLEPPIKSQLHKGFCVQVSGVHRSNGRYDQVVEDQLSRVTSLNRNIHTGNMGGVILFKLGGGGGAREAGGDGEEGSISFISPFWQEQKAPAWKAFDQQNTQHQNIPTMMTPFATPRHSFDDGTCLNSGSLPGRGWPRPPWKGLVL